MKKNYILALLSFLFLGCSFLVDDELTYKYVVVGTSGNNSVTFKNSSDEIQEWGTIGNRWEYSWGQSGKRWLFIEATNNQSSGSVTVEIYRDGDLIASNTASSSFGTATVSGRF